MMQLNFNQIVLKPGQNLLLEKIDWSMLESLLEEWGEHRSSRISYSHGILEVMIPLAEHEDDKTIIGNLIEILLEELDIEFRALGSTTLKHEKIAQAIEPDECFYITHESLIRGKSRLDLTQDPPPDLAIEIDITSRTHLDNYEQLGIPELWRYDGKHLEIHVLQAGQYVLAETSQYFPKLALKTFIPYAIEKSKVVGRNAMMKEFRAWLKKSES